jgi:hypothetical protein
MKLKRLTVKLDPHTFGGTRASEKLADILNEHYPELVTKVGGFYHKFTAQMTNCANAAHHFPEGGLRTMMELYKKQKFETVSKSGMPPAVISHLLNIMSASYKQNLVIVNQRMQAAQQLKPKNPNAKPETLGSA